MIKKILVRSLILGVLISLFALLGMGIIDFVVFAIIALLLIIAASVVTIAHNQRIDKK